MADRKGGARRVWTLALALAWAVPGARLGADVTLAGTPAFADAPLSAGTGGTFSVEGASGSAASAGVSGAARASGPAGGTVFATPLAATAAGTPAPAAAAPQAAGLPSGFLVLALPGRADLRLAELPDSAGAPRFSVGAAAAYAGFGARWRSSEKMLELSAGGRVRARLVLDGAVAVVGGVLLRLRRPLELAEGAPALDPGGLRALFRALGVRRAVWTLSAGPSGAGPSSAVPPTAPVSSIPVASSSSAVPAPSSPFPGPSPPPSILAVPAAHVAARPLTGARIRTIVVDAGHGGKDPGAHGPDGLREKDVCLDIALRLRRELNRRDPSLRVVLTRDGDYFVTLEGRTRIANRARGDLFLSIHNNASPDPRTHGTQVFFFDSQSSDRAAADLTLRENGETNQLDILMTDLAKSIVRDQSIGFASLVQRSLGQALNLRRRTVSYAPFYVLARTEMPAILVEVAFITNPREEDLLGSEDFRQQVADGLATGIENYARLVSAKP